jgi:hypothetical protein
MRRAFSRFSHLSMSLFSRHKYIYTGQDTGSSKTNYNFRSEGYLYALYILIWFFSFLLYTPLSARAWDWDAKYIVCIYLLEFNGEIRFHPIAEQDLLISRLLSYIQTKIGDFISEVKHEDKKRCRIYTCIYSGLIKEAF